MSGFNVLPKLKFGAGGVSLGSNMACLCNRHLKDQAPAVIRNASHDV